jgi:hypothetical protein
MSTGAGFPQFDMQIVPNVGFTLIDSGPESILRSQPILIPNRRDELEEFPTTLHIDTKSDYDYDDLSHYTMFRDRLEELKLGWPLTEEDEDKIEQKLKKKFPTQEDFDAQLIQNAYARANNDQQGIMRELADRLNYTL